MRKRFREFFIYSVLGIKDSPHRIALGVAISVFIAITPTIPFQTALMLLICVLLGANKVVGLPFIWVTNPLTFVPIYGSCFILGSWIVPGDYSAKRFMSGLKEISEAQLALLDRMELLWGLTLDFFWPLWIGCILVGMIAALLSYYLIYDAVLSYHRLKEKFHHQPEMRGSE